jgi:hypothetical protein
LMVVMALLVLTGSSEVMTGKPLGVVARTYAHSHESIDTKGLVILLKDYNGFSGGQLYALAIFGDGTVVYRGMSFVNFTGLKMYKVPEKRVSELAIGFFELKDDYRPCGADCCGSSLSLTLRDHTKSVSISSCACEHPEGFSELKAEVIKVSEASYLIY